MADGPRSLSCQLWLLCCVALCCVLRCVAVASLPDPRPSPADRSKLGGITEAGVSDLQAAGSDPRAPRSCCRCYCCSRCRCGESWERWVTAAAGVRNGASTTFPAVHPHVRPSVLIDTLTDSLFCAAARSRGGSGASSRFHIPLWPLLCLSMERRLVSLTTLSLIVPMRRRRRRRRHWRSLMFCVFAFLFLALRGFCLLEHRRESVFQEMKAP